MTVGPFEFKTYIAACVAVVALAGIVPLIIPGKPHLLRRLLASTLFVLIASLVALTPTPGLFESAHVAYAILVWSVPLFGTALLAFAILRKKWPVIALAVLCLLPAPIGYYATNIEPHRLETNTFDVGESSAEPLKIVVMSDIQTPSVGKHDLKAVDAATRQNADLILYAGDLYSAENNIFPSKRPEFVDMVSRMRAKQGVLIVEGDHDDHYLRGIVKDGGATFLDNEVRVENIRGKRVGVLGVGVDYASKEATTQLDAFAKRTDLDYKIVLSHKPDVIYNTPAGINLVAAGHTHGGQVQVPFVGPLVTLSDIPRDQAAGGLYDYSEGRKLFVTRGIGVEYGNAPFVRFGAVPEIDVLNISFP